MAIQSKKCALELLTRRYKSIVLHTYYFLHEHSSLLHIEVNSTTHPMHLPFILSLALANCITAIPVLERTSKLETRKNNLCGSGLYSTPMCCATDVLGLADLDCSTPHELDSEKSFIRSCATHGQRARCCAIPALGQALLCTAPGDPAKRDIAKPENTSRDTKGRNI